MLSYSNFGSVDNVGTRKPREAVDILHNDADVDFPVDGEMQADTAVVDDILNDTYEFSELDEAANVLVFPNLEAGTSATSCSSGSVAQRPLVRCWSEWTSPSTCFSEAMR